MRRVPQVHSHPHKAFPFEANPVWCITVQRPNRCPVRSMNRKLGLTIGVPFTLVVRGPLGVDAPGGSRLSGREATAFV
jgi:hypothetical protein